MKRIIKISTSILISILTIIGINNLSDAYYVGQDVTVTFDQYESANNIYCIERGQALTTTNTYSIISNVKIEGTKSIDHKGKTIDSKYNARFAYILSGNNGSSKDSGQVANAIWNFGYSWMKNVGYNHAGLYNGFASSTKGTYATKLEQDAITYADNITKGSKAQDNTNKDKIKANAYEKDGKSYVRVGPFNWTFAGTLNDISVYDQNNTEVSTKILYSRFSGNKENLVSVSEIKSGKDFYISIPTNSGISKITKITGTSKIDVKGVNIWFLKSKSDYKQNLLIRSPYSTSQNIDLSFKYNISILGNLKVIKVDKDNNTIRLSNVGFKIQNKETGKYIKQAGDGTITYVEESKATEFTTNKNGEITIKKLVVGTYIAYETKNPNYGYEIVTDGKSKKVTVDKTAELQIPNKKVLGNLKVIKVDADNNQIKLKGVTFYIQNKDTKKYVKRASNGKITYVEKSNATPFETDEKGEILIKELIVGTYVAYEKDNPYYGYEILTNGQEKKIVVDKTAELQIPNKREYLKLSGYVWVDKMPQGKGERNNLYHNGSFDSNDILLDGIKVKLVDKSGNTIKETTTKNGGKYLFEDVLVDKVKQKEYHIEFEYDGVTYTNVIKDLEKDNGSKAIENEKVRTTFNNNFTYVEGKSNNTSSVKDQNKNEKYTINYDIKQEQNKCVSTAKHNEQFNIVADTTSAGYEIKYVPGQDEIKNINLGLYEREQVDISIAKDIYNVDISINGKTHAYEYNSIFKDDITPGQDDFDNLGISYKEKYTGTYIRPIYKSDYIYNSEDASKNLKVNVTYKIRMINETTSLTEQVNTIIDHYDSNYTLVAAGTELNKNDLQIVDKQENTGNEFNSAKINVNKQINYTGTNYEDVYIKFELNKDAIETIVNNGENLDNYVEIYSYSTYKDGKIYAAIDKDSNPGNMTGDRLNKIVKTSDYMERKKLMEDDEDSAPGLKLVWAADRQLSGTVFLDSTDGKLHTGEVREGNGIYDESQENGIPGVTVNLIESTTGKVCYTATTDDNGNFTISGYVPGDYKLVYIWGNETYTVKNYKGTIYKNPSRASNTSWYTENIEDRYSDAKDDYTIRQSIDNGTEANTTMNSTTPQMDIGIDTVGNGSSWIKYEDIQNSLNGNIVETEYTIKNVDFGIVERARQSIGLTKRISTFKVTLANGQVVSEVTIGENGEITGKANNITYMAPSKDYVRPNGYIWLQLDEELMQGATLEVVYEVKAINNSELDYNNSDFYMYGQESNNKSNPVTITPSGIIDYLDKDWAYEQDKNTQWQEKTIDDLKTLVADVVYNNEQSTINEKRILYTESLKDKKLEATQSESVMLNVSKMLSSSEEIELGNEAEIAKVEKDGGSKLITTPGNYIPGLEEQQREDDDSMAETAIVTPPTGNNNKSIIVTTILGITSLAILGTGIVLIKRKAIKR